MALREKRMAAADWPAFQGKFADVVLASGAPSDMALFGRKDPNDYDTEIMLVADPTAKAEALSPGGWQNAVDPQQHKWTLLVGNHGAEEDFGLELGF